MRHNMIMGVVEANRDGRGGGAAVAEQAETPMQAAARLIPWVAAGFRLDIGKKDYPQDDGALSKRIANVICKLKGCDDAAPFYFLANVNRIKMPVGKPQVRLTLPAQMRGAGSYAKAILSTDSDAGKAALEAWKAETLAACVKWLKDQNLTAVIGGNAFAGSSMEVDDLGI